MQSVDNNLKQLDIDKCKLIKVLRSLSQPAFAISTFNLFIQLLFSVCKWLGAKAEVNEV